ncbi:carcinoembryonic antigen-related cell adhesion molecule 18-like [Pseudophryne corroboree]|uniref:carcinoembryonic antigen-related cell adhesion molecule 18-like n=1 Tax=Pseudophryne corroboree TaxID=495146 RepID=UPI00308213B9
MTCNRNKWQRLCFMAVFLCIQVEQNWCQIYITTIPQRPTVGGNVTFLVRTIGEIYNINWYRGSKTYDDDNILTHSPGSQDKPTTGPRYTWREDLQNDGTLVISNLAMNYSGLYTVQLTLPNSLPDKTVELTVYPADEITLAPSATFTLEKDQTSSHHTTDSTYHVANATLPVASTNTITLGIVIGAIGGGVIGCIIAGLLVWMTKCRKRSQEPIYENTETFGKLPYSVSYVPDLPVYNNSSVYTDLIKRDHSIYQDLQISNQ